jgi:carbamoyl-phosphate synthase large subunit
LGVIVQFGGQTPLKLAVPLERACIRLLGTTADAIDRAEDRERFDALLSKLKLERPRAGIAKGAPEAKRIAADIGYPVLVRPSYVLGGRAMMICWDEAELDAYVELAIEAAREEGGSQTLLIDRVPEERDRGRRGLRGRRPSRRDRRRDAAHRGCRHPLGRLDQRAAALQPGPLGGCRDRAQHPRLALELGVVGLMNVQFAVKDGKVYVLEVNPRASRTVPFVSKATGRPLAKIAAKVMVGETLDALGVKDEPVPTHVAVKESVFPFAKFPGVDTILGPEMRSTGEVMGISVSLPLAFGKSMAASGYSLPDHGRAFISVQDDDKPAACDVARRLRNLGFSIVATGGTAQELENARIPVERINKVLDGSPHVVDAIEAGTIQVVVNTTQGAKAIRDSYSIRRTTLLANIPYFTTLSAARAAVDAIEVRFVAGRNISAVRSLQEWHQRSRRATSG